MTNITIPRFQLLEMPKCRKSVKERDVSVSFDEIPNLFMRHQLGGPVE